MNTAFIDSCFRRNDKNIAFCRSLISKNSKGGRRYLPYAFTEQGVAMLSGVLRSDATVKISIQIMEAFVTMRKFISTNAQIFHRLDTVEKKQVEHDQKFGENWV